MDSISFHLDVISGVGSLYSGSVKSVRVTGSEGEWASDTVILLC